MEEVYRRPVGPFGKVLRFKEPPAGLREGHKARANDTTLPAAAQIVPLVNPDPHWQSLRFPATIRFGLHLENQRTADHDVFRQGLQLYVRNDVV
jgi:hypothetical protein